MRKLTWVLFGVVVLYSGYWFIAARATENGVAAWLADRETQGWQTEYSALATRGYPLTFKTTLTDVALADPATGLAYQTSEVSVQSRSFTPTRLKAQMATDARLSTPFQHLDFTNTSATATLHVEAGPALTLQSATIDIDALAGKSTLGWGFSLDSANATAVRRADDTLAHDLTISIDNFAPSAAMMARLNPDGILSDSFDAMNISATVRFDKNWDITALEGPRPQPSHVLLRNMAATWGALNLRIAGAFDVDANGVADGTISIKATNWREMITLATAAGIIPPKFENLAQRGGAMLAGLSGNPNTIDAELTLARGAISLGFLPLGPAPLIKIR